MEMTWLEFKQYHPDFIWWLGTGMLFLMLSFLIWVWRYEHQPLSCPNAEAERRHRHYVVFASLVLGGTIPALVLWLTWLVWRGTLIYQLHLFLGG